MSAAFEEPNAASAQRPTHDETGQAKKTCRMGCLLQWLVMPRWSYKCTTERAATEGAIWVVINYLGLIRRAKHPEFLRQIGRSQSHGMEPFYAPNLIDMVVRA